jgi:hypothetical protein
LHATAAAVASPKMLLDLLIAHHGVRSSGRSLPNRITDGEIIAECRDALAAIERREPPRVRSSKQLPTNQGDTDNTEKHEPNEIHPEDYGVCVAYDQSVAASTK